MGFRFLLSLIGLLLLFASWASQALNAPSPPKPIPPRADSFLRQIKDYELLTDAVMETGQVVGLATAIVKDGEVISARGLGLTEAGMGIGKNIDTNTAFRLASLSKSFAATLSALLVDDGYFKWDDAVQSYVPFFELQDSHQSAKLTIRELLSHRVGLPYNTQDRLLEKSEPYPILLHKLRNVPMMCGVGDCYAYQNIAYSLIGDIAFATTGDFFSHQIERRLFHPLAMVGATYGREALLRSKSWARPHVRNNRGWRAIMPKDTYYQVLPAAGVNATIIDMTQWLLAQLGHFPEVIPPETLKDIHAPLVETPGEIAHVPWRRERVLKAEYAMGWRIYDYSGHTMVFHGGAVQGYRAIMALLPEEDLGIVILWNCESAVPSGLLPTFLDAYLGLPYRDWLNLSSFQKPKPAAARKNAPRRAASKKRR